MYRPVIALAELAFKALGLTVRIDGLENVPVTGGAVLASNHVSYLDFLFVGLAPWHSRRRYTRFMAKEEVFAHRVAGPLMRGMGHIAVDRQAGSASLRAALKALKAGELVGVFPEGTISSSFTVKKLKPGTTRMAAAARVPVVPVAVWGGQRMFTKGRGRSFRRGQTVLVRVGEPFFVGPRDDQDAATGDLRVRLQRLLDAAQAAHPDTAGAGPQHWWVPAHLGGGAPTPEQARALEDADRDGPGARA